MPRKTSGKPITIKLDAAFRKALEYFQKHGDINHMPLTEQVRRALIFYWIRAGVPHGTDALNFVMPGWEPGDEEFGVVVEGQANDGSNS
jgi:hypothetical protein